MSVDVKHSIRRLADTRDFEAPIGKSAFTLILSLIVVLNVLFVSWSESKKYPGIDFFAFWSVEQTVRQGDVAEVYSAEGSNEVAKRLETTLRDPHLSARQKTATRMLLQFENGNIGIVATPFLFSTLSLWEHGNYDRDLTLFAFCCLVLYACAVVMLSRVFGFTLIASAFFLILFSAGFAAYASDVRVANTNQLQLFAVALFLWIQRRPGNYRDVTSGIVLGLSIMFKPDVALMAVLLALVWLFNRRFEKAKMVFAGAAVGAVFAMLFSSIFFGTVACWAEWLHAAPAVVQSKFNGGLDLGNYGLATVLHSIMSVDLSVVLVSILLCAFAYIAWTSRTPPKFGRHEKNGRTPQPAPAADSLFLETASAVCLGLTFMLLSSKLVWFHYYILAIPAIILAFSISFRVGNCAMQATAPRVLSVVGAVCLIRFPVELLPLPLVVQALTLNIGVIMISLVIAHGLMVREKDYRVKASNSLTAGSAK